MEKKEKVLGETYEKGKPEKPYNWRKKLSSREEMLKYLQSGERYWYSKEWPEMATRPFKEVLNSPLNWAKKMY